MLDKNEIKQIYEKAYIKQRDFAIKNMMEHLIGAIRSTAGLANKEFEYPIPPSILEFYKRRGVIDVITSRIKWLQVKPHTEKPTYIIVSGWTF